MTRSSGSWPIARELKVALFHRALGGLEPLVNGRAAAVCFDVLVRVQEIVVVVANVVMAASWTKLRFTLPVVGEVNRSRSCLNRCGASAGHAENCRRTRRSEVLCCIGICQDDCIGVGVNLYRDHMLFVRLFSPLLEPCVCFATHCGSCAPGEDAQLRALCAAQGIGHVDRLCANGHFSTSHALRFAYGRNETFAAAARIEIRCLPHGSVQTAGHSLACQGSWSRLDMKSAKRVSTMRCASSGAWAWTSTCHFEHIGATASATHQTRSTIVP